MSTSNVTQTSSQEPERKLQKTLTWKDGFALSLVIPNGLFVTFGYLIGAVGAWTAITIWVVATIVSMLQNAILGELAAMFPGKSGGVARYAIEGWKKYFIPVGAVASFGYWMGWSLSLSVTAVGLGYLLQTSFIPAATASVAFAGNDLGFAHVIAIATIVIAWMLNRRGVKLGATINKWLGVFVIIGLMIVAFGPFVVDGGIWDASRLTWHVEGDWMTVVVVYYATAWVTYGTEICASFAPEYKDTARDTSKALLSSSAFMLALFTLVPLGVIGSIGEDAVSANPVGYIGTSFETLLGSGAWIGVLIVAANMFIAMMSGTADGARALYGLAQEGFTLRQLDHLNKFGVPGRGLALDAIVNIVILILLANPVSILLASNLGYLTSITLGIAAFLLLRKDRPDWPRPIRRSPIWIPIAWFIVLLNAFVISIGVARPDLAGYGSHTQTLIGLGILALSVVLYIYRQVVQDRKKLVWRDRSVQVPDAADFAE
ncbi:MAG: APC family permease [Salinibacterium amurskyense]